MAGQGHTKDRAGQKNAAGGLCCLFGPGMDTPPSEEVHSEKVQSHSESKLRGGQEVGS